MRKGLPKINKLIALILALVLFTSSSVGVYAEGDVNITSIENISVDTSSEDASEETKEPSVRERKDADAQGESEDESTGKSEKSVINDKTSDSTQDEEKDKNIEDSSDKTDEATTVTEDEKEKTSNKNTSKDETELKHSDEHELEYQSLGNGKHKVTCTQCEDFEPTEEACDFDENGKCKDCDFYDETKDSSKKKVQKEMTLSCEYEGVRFEAHIEDDTFETEEVSLVVAAVSEDIENLVKENAESLVSSGYKIEAQNFDISFKHGDSVIKPNKKVKITVSCLKFAPKVISHIKGSNVGVELEQGTEWDINEDGSVWISSVDFSPFIFITYEEKMADVPSDGILYGGNPENPNSPYGFGGTEEKHLDKLYRLNEIQEGYCAVRILSHNSEHDSYPVIAPYTLQQNLYFVYDPEGAENYSIHLYLKAPENYTIASVCLKGGSNITPSEDGAYNIPLEKISEEKNVNEIVVNLKKIEIKWDDNSEPTYISGGTLVNYKDSEIEDSKGYIRKNFGDAFHFNQGDEKNPASNYCYYRQVYQGLASDIYDPEDGGFKLANGTDILFKNNSEYIKDYRSNVGVEFKKDVDGYWTLDSDTSRYEIVTEGDKDILKQVSGEKSFRPFGDDDHFGMILPIDFTIDGEGKNSDGKDTIFKFAGDDDVFVYIDGKLVLDLGGIHDSVNGQINFNTGDILIQGDNENILTSSVDGSCYRLKNLGSKNLYSIVGPKKSFVRDKHQLTVVYFERGAHLSDCRISYNFNAINFVKDPGYLNIVKTLKNYQAEFGTAVSVFEIQYRDPDGSAHSYTYSYDFNESGTKDSILLELPADTEITVFECYSGASYSLESISTKDGTVTASDKTPTGKEAVITIAEGETSKVEFVNSYDGRINYGTISITNVFKKNAENIFEFFKRVLGSTFLGIELEGGEQ